MKLLSALLRDRRGLGAVEFALLCPVLCLMIIGTAQLGTLFYAHAGLRNSVAEGARIASIYPTPSAATIKARMAAKRFGLQSQFLSTPTVTTGTDSGVSYVQITQTYNVPLDFIFVDVPSVRLTQTRRTYVYPS